MSTPDLSHIVEQLRPLAVACADLNLDIENARIHPPDNVAATRASMERFGQYLPLVVQRAGMIVRVGNNRLGIARKLGWSHIAAVVTDHPEEVARALADADNRTAELAKWDDEALKKLLVSVKEIDPALIAATGFNESEFRALCEVKWVPPSEADKSAGAVGGAPLSHVRMVQLFFNETTQKEFLAMVDEAAAKLKTSSLTDTVMAVMRAHRSPSDS